MVQTVLLHQPVSLSWSVLQDHIHYLIIYLFYSSTPGDISVTIDGADCAVTSVSNTELECVTGPHTLSDYIRAYLFYSSTPGDISVTIGGADCAVTSASITKLECVTGPHTLSDYIFILQFHSRGHQCNY